MRTTRIAKTTYWSKRMIWIHEGFAGGLIFSGNA